MRLSASSELMSTGDRSLDRFRPVLGCLTVAGSMRQTALNNNPWPEGENTRTERTASTCRRVNNSTSIDWSTKHRRTKTTNRKTSDSFRFWLANQRDYDDYRIAAARWDEIHSRIRFNDPAGSIVQVAVGSQAIWLIPPWERARPQTNGQPQIFHCNHGDTKAIKNLVSSQNGFSHVDRFPANSILNGST